MRIVSQLNGVRTNVKKRDGLWLVSLLGQKLAHHVLGPVR